MIARTMRLAALAFLLLGGSAAHANEAQIVGEKPVEGGTELTIETPAFNAPARVEVFLPRGTRRTRRGAGR